MHLLLLKDDARKLRAWERADASFVPRFGLGRAESLQSWSDVAWWESPGLAGSCQLSVSLVSVQSPEVLMRLSSLRDKGENEKALRN